MYEEYIHFLKEFFQSVILFCMAASSPFTVELIFAQWFCMKKILSVFGFTVVPEMLLLIGSVIFITFTVALC